MVQIVALVLNDVSHLAAVSTAWAEAGVGGITILQSIGMQRLLDRCKRDDLPLFPSMRDLLEQEELYHRMIFTVVDSDALVDRLIEATEAVVGNLDAERTGILFTIPVGRVRGLRQPK